MAEHPVPVVVEIILERVTNIAMGAEIDNVVEFEDLAKDASRRPNRHRAPRLRTPFQGPTKMPKFAANC